MDMANKISIVVSRDVMDFTSLNQKVNGVYTHAVYHKGGVGRGEMMLVDGYHRKAAINKSLGDVLTERKKLTEKGTLNLSAEDKAELDRLTKLIWNSGSWLAAIYCKGAP